MAKKIAGSGLNIHHLELAHKRKPHGIQVACWNCQGHKIKDTDRIGCYIFFSLKIILTYCYSSAGFDNEIFIISIIIIH